MSNWVYLDVTAYLDVMPCFLCVRLSLHTSSGNEDLLTSWKFKEWCLVLRVQFWILTQIKLMQSYFLSFLKNWQWERERVRLHLHAFWWLTIKGGMLLFLVLHQRETFYDWRSQRKEVAWWGEWPGTGSEVSIYPQTWLPIYIAPISKLSKHTFSCLAFRSHFYSC